MALFFERPESGETAVLVHIKLTSESEPEDPREFEELVIAAGGDPVEFITGSRQSPSAKFFVGSGKLDEIKATVQRTGAELVIFNHNLSPSQERNIEAELQCRVLDRTGLILDIFAQRARTHEGKLQVELAQLQHLSSRLVRGWTHLERQKGGIGMRGPGETQLESDRRMVRDRIKSIEKRTYIDPESGTVDYVLMFIPNESIYAFLNQEDRDIIDYSLSKKVLLCSPVTLYAVLSLIRQSVSNFSMEQKAGEVQQLMGVFKKQWNEFLLQMDKLGNTIGTVQTHFEKLVSTRKNQLEKPMDKINDLQLGQLDNEKKLKK